MKIRQLSAITEERRAPSLCRTLVVQTFALTGSDTLHLPPTQGDLQSAVRTNSDPYHGVDKPTHCVLSSANGIPRRTVASMVPSTKASRENNLINAVC